MANIYFSKIIFYVKNFYIKILKKLKYLQIYLIYNLN